MRANVPKRPFLPLGRSGFAPLPSRALAALSYRKPVLRADQNGRFGRRAPPHCRGYIIPPCPPEGDEAATALVGVSRFLLPTPSAGWQKKAKKENPPAYIPLRPQGDGGSAQSAPPTPKGGAEPPQCQGTDKIFSTKKFYSSLRALDTAENLPEGVIFSLL